MLVWAVLPTDVTALITATLANRFLKYVFELPYSRKLEQEADSVGLVLAAKVRDREVKRIISEPKVASLTSRFNSRLAST